MATEKIGFHNAAELLDRCMVIFKKSFIQQIGMYMVCQMISSSIITLFGFVGGVGLVSALMATPDPIQYFSQFDDWYLLFIVGFVFMYLFVLLNNFMLSAGSLLSWQVFSERRIDFGDALKRSFMALGRLATATFAQLIAISAVIAVAFALLQLFAPDLLSSASWLFNPQSWDFVLDDSRALFAVLRLYAVIIIFALFVVVILNYFSLATSAALFDNRHFFGALAKSFMLIKGDFLRILGLRIAFFGASFLIEYSIMGLFAIITGVTAGISETGYGDYMGLATASMALTYIVMLAASAIVAPLQNIFTSMVFFNQKIKHEGLDIGITLEHLEYKHVV
ncbi:MAG: hypothetical protein LBL96_10960 [Clostridiales bacterium]|nr:hypothetical protein [Clostridiales bacterium]